MEKGAGNDDSLGDESSVARFSGSESDASAENTRIPKAKQAAACGGVVASAPVADDIQPSLSKKAHG